MKNLFVVPMILLVTLGASANLEPCSSSELPDAQSCSKANPEAGLIELKKGWKLLSVEKNGQAIWFHNLTNNFRSIINLDSDPTMDPSFNRANSSEVQSLVSVIESAGASGSEPFEVSWGKKPASKTIEVFMRNTKRGQRQDPEVFMRNTKRGQRQDFESLTGNGMQQIDNEYYFNP